jgi:GNAT superfamily N-acetyltransferase
MKIRGAEIQDVRGVAELVRGLSSYYLEDGQDEIPVGFKATITESAFSDRFKDPEVFNFVAEIDGSIAGYIAIKSGFHLYHLFVSPGFHKRGIARSLWQHCVAELKIEQCTVRSSDFAVPVYLKFGFNISGEREVKDGIAFQPMRYDGASC